MVISVHIWSYVLINLDNFLVNNFRNICIQKSLNEGWGVGSKAVRSIPEIHPNWWTQLSKLRHVYTWLIIKIITTLSNINIKKINKTIKLQKEKRSKQYDANDQALWDWVILFLVIYTAIFTPYVAVSLQNSAMQCRKSELNKSSWKRKYNEMKCNMSFFSCILKPGLWSVVNEIHFNANTIIPTTVRENKMTHKQSFFPGLPA